MAKYWGASEQPPLQEWKKGMELYMSAEMVTYKAKGCPKMFRKIWGPWMKYYGVDLGDSERELLSTLSP